MRPLKLVSAEEAVSAVKSHDHIHISSAGHVPQILIEALCRCADAGELEDIHFQKEASPSLHSLQEQRMGKVKLFLFLMRGQV